jgi:hypothetical protein
MAFPLEIKSVYNFSTLAPSVLGIEIKNATILGIFDYNIASNYISPEAKHAVIYPLLPPGTVNDPKKFTYFLFRSESGTNEVYAIEWVNIATIFKIVSQTITITVTNAQNGDAVNIRDSLIQLGFRSFDVKVS